MGHFQTRSESLREERYGFSIRTDKSTTYWNLVSPCAVFLGQCSVWTTFGKQILLGNFQLRSESLGAERYGDLIQTYQSTTYIVLLEFGEKS